MARTKTTEESLTIDQVTALCAESDEAGDTDTFDDCNCLLEAWTERGDGGAHHECTVRIVEIISDAEGMLD